MNKKFIAVFALVAVVAFVFLYIRSSKKEAEDQRIAQEAFARLTNVAVKVPQAGLSQMGKALNHYREKNGKYPVKLMDLYPDFVPSREFISAIDWYYESRGDNFFLSKTVTQKEERVVASIDKNLKPALGAGIAIAAAPKTPATEPKASVTALPEIADLKPLAPVGVTERPVQVIEEEKPSLIAQPEVVSVEPGVIGEGISAEIGEQFLVWKTEQGALGFGNVIYPDQRTIAIYADNSWINIESPAPPVQQRPTAVPGAGAADISERYLVWKDRSGRIGYGNVSYPDTEKLSVFRESSWVDVEKEDSAAQSVPASRPDEYTDKKSADIASGYSDQYMVWKDKNGNIGYGNVQYPESDIAYICINGTWQKLKE